MGLVMIAGIAFAGGIILLGVYARDDDDDGGDYVRDEGAAIRQYREWKTQATSYSEMEELEDMIDEARARLRARGGG